MNRIYLTTQARRDIQTILVFFEASGPATLKLDFLHAVRNSCERLIRFPLLGRRLAKKSLLRAEELDLRQLSMDRFDRYLIIYAVADEIVSITRIIHGARDPKLREADPS